MTSVQAEGPVENVTGSLWEGDQVIDPGEVGAGVLIKKGGGSRLI